MIDLSHNEIFDLAPATFVSQPNMLLIDMSHNKILRVPYGAFGRRVVTVLLQGKHQITFEINHFLFLENPLVCTEKIHMLQQGIGMLISNSEDIVCGAQRSIEKIIEDQSDKVIQPVASNRTTSRSQEDFNSDPILQQPNNQATMQQPIIQPNSAFHSNPVLRNEDFLAAAFRQAEEDERKFKERGGFVPRGDEHQNEPRLNPTIPPIPSLISGGSNEILQRPSTTSSSMSGEKKPTKELTIRPLTTETNREVAAEKSPFLVSSGESNSRARESLELTTPIEDEMFDRNGPAPVPNLKMPTKIHPAYPLNTHTLPPSIVIATNNRLDERIDLTPESTRNSPLTPSMNPSRSSPTTTKNQERNEPFNVDELHRISTSQQTPSNNIELRGDKSLPTLLIIICLSTVGVVLVAVFVGLCFVNKRRGQQQFFGSSNSSMTARSNSYYGTNTLVHQHPNSQTYISPNQFDASQMSTVQRTR